MNTFVAASDDFMALHYPSLSCFVVSNPYVFLQNVRLSQQLLHVRLSFLIIEVQSFCLKILVATDLIKTLCLCYSFVHCCYVENKSFKQHLNACQYVQENF
jgi:cell shape-determining protein MreD